MAFCVQPAHGTGEVVRTEHQRQHTLHHSAHHCPSTPREFWAAPSPLTQVQAHTALRWWATRPPARAQATATPPAALTTPPARYNAPLKLSNSKWARLDKPGMPALTGCHVVQSVVVVTFIVIHSTTTTALLCTTNAASTALNGTLPDTRVHCACAQETATSATASRSIPRPGRLFGPRHGHVASHSLWCMCARTYRFSVTRTLHS